MAHTRMNEQMTIKYYTAATARKHSRPVLFFMYAVSAGTLLVLLTKLRSPLCFCLTCCDTLNLRPSPSTTTVAASQRPLLHTASRTSRSCL
jgi:uncharacterized membrane protein YjjP (DUF1212 family)